MYHNPFNPDTYATTGELLATRAASDQGFAFLRRCVYRGYHRSPLVMVFFQVIRARIEAGVLRSLNTEPAPVEDDTADDQLVDDTARRRDLVDDPRPPPQALPVVAPITPNAPPILPGIPSRPAVARRLSL